MVIQTAVSIQQAVSYDLSCNILSYGNPDLFAITINPSSTTKWHTTTFTDLIGYVLVIENISYTIVSLWNSTDNTWFFPRMDKTTVNSYTGGI